MSSTPPLGDLPWRERLRERKDRSLSWARNRRRPLNRSGVLIGGLCLTIAVWPLVIAVWDLLGLSSWRTWRSALFAIGGLLLAAGVVGSNWRRSSPIRLMRLILVAWLVAAIAVVALTGLAWLVLDTPGWKPPENLAARHLEAITTRAFAIVAGLGGVALLVIAYRRQRTTETGEQREIVKLFNERFTTAYTELGSDHAAVRLGAIHALAHLADDAPSEDEVQMVIDVLCAYLRMPYFPMPEALPRNASKSRREEHRERELEFASFREVRHTIIRIIGDHLREPTRWRGKDFDFTGVVFDGGDLHGAHFTGGRVSFSETRFIGGTMDFSGARFSGGDVNFARARFTGGDLEFFDTHFSGGDVNFVWSQFADSAVSFIQARFTGGRVSFLANRFTNGKTIFSEALFGGGEVIFSSTRFTGGRADFDDTEFSGSEVSFLRAEFIDCEASFSRVDFSDGRVFFDKASGTCPANLLEAVERGKTGVVTLSEEW
ncbi:pentapeptide repeat-containing protein [Nocardiopsis alba]|uniref:pentapeptide repeat-containing protein n=1 Tax=Nocardiopsis alba TaxID=53437 RepID=UPI0033C654EC